MPLIIPDLSATRVEILSTCATIDFTEPDDSDWFGSSRVDFDFDLASGNAGHRLFLGISKTKAEKGHFHLNLAVRTVLDQDSLPAPQGSLNELQSLYSHIKDRAAKVTVTGHFILSLDDLPNQGIVKEMLRVSAKFGDVQVAVNGVDLVLKGGADKRIRWSQIGDNLRGFIESRFDMPLTEDYLERAIQEVERGITRYMTEAT